MKRFFKHILDEYKIEEVYSDFLTVFELVWEEQKPEVEKIERFLDFLITNSEHSGSLGLRESFEMLRREKRRAIEKYDLEKCNVNPIKYYGIEIKIMKELNDEVVQFSYDKCN